MTGVQTCALPIYGAVGRVGGEFEGVGHEPEGVHGQAQQRRVGGAVGQGGINNLNILAKYIDKVYILYRIYYKML